MTKFWYIFLLLMTFALAGSCQEEVRKSGKYSEQKIPKILQGLKGDFDIKLAYDSKSLKRIITSFEFEQLTADEALGELLTPFGLEFSMINGTYVIFEKTKNQPSIGDPTQFDFDFSSRVVDSSTQEPLPYASVSLLSGSGAAANEEGYFTLKNIPSDTISLLVSYVGYQSRTLKLTPDWVKSGAPIGLASINNLPLIIIQGEAPSMIKLNNQPSTLFYDINAVKKMPNSGESDVIRMIQLGSGINATGENSSEINVRGGASDENLVLYDGMTIYHLDHLYGIFSAFNTNSIQNVKIHKGVTSPKFGGRTSSVIEFTGKTGDKKIPSGQIDLTLLSASFLIESPIIGEKASLMISGRRSYTDVVSTAVYQGLFNGLYNSSITAPDDAEVDVFNQDTGPDFFFYDVTAKIGWKSAKQDRFTFSLYSGKDNLLIGYNSTTADRRFQIDYNDNSSWGNNGASFNWTKQWNADHFSKYTLSYSNYGSELFSFDNRLNLIQGIEETAFFDRNTSIQDVSLKGDHEKYIQEHKIGYGFGFNYFEINSSELIANSIDTSKTSNANLIAGYINDEFSPLYRMTVNAGARVSYYRNTNTLYTEPRLVVKGGLAKNLDLFGSFGRNYQFIRRTSRQNLFLNIPDTWELVNLTEVPVLEVNQFEVGLQFHTELISIETSVYSKQRKGSVLNKNTVVSLNQDNIESDFILGNGWAKGFELLVSKNKGAHSGWIAYTLSRSKDLFEEISSNEIPVSHDQLHELKSAYRWKKNHFEANLIFIYGSGRPYTPVLDAYSLTLLNGDEQQFIAFGDENSARLNAYHRLDFSASYSFLLAFGTAEVGLSLYNIYDRNNIDSRQYFISEISDTDLAVGQRDLAMIGFTPSLQITLKW